MAEVEDLADFLAQRDDRQLVVVVHDACHALLARAAQAGRAFKEAAAMLAPGLTKGAAMAHELRPGRKLARHRSALLAGQEPRRWLPLVIPGRRSARGRRARHAEC